MYRFPIRRAITLIGKEFSMSFVDTNDDVFLGEKYSRRGMWLSTVM